MTKKYFIGIDVSKHTLDAAVIIRHKGHLDPPLWKQFDNSLPGLEKMKKWLNQTGIPFTDRSIIVIENTGLYHRLLWQFCTKLTLDLCIENAAQVKWSLGIARGKNDKVDSRRLALYAARHADRLKPTPAVSSELQSLKDLMTLRNKLLTQFNSLRTALSELKAVSPKGFIITCEIDLNPALKGLKEALKRVEAEIRTIIDEDKKISHVYKLLITVPGIGRITAVALICCSNIFTSCQTGKQLASYCGVVPFEYQSGISIRGRNRVHKMANKEMKKLLYMCVLSAIQHYDEFRDYYDRKIDEGKHPMSVINAIKNKIVLRAFAVVKNDEPYVNNYGMAA